MVVSFNPLELAKKNKASLSIPKDTFKGAAIKSIDVEVWEAAVLPPTDATTLNNKWGKRINTITKAEYDWEALGLKQDVVLFQRGSLGKPLAMDLTLEGLGNLYSGSMLGTNANPSATDLFGNNVRLIFRLA